MGERANDDGSELKIITLCRHLLNESAMTPLEATCQHFVLVLWVSNVRSITRPILLQIFFNNVFISDNGVLDTSPIAALF